MSRSLSALDGHGKGSRDKGAEHDTLSRESFHGRIDTEHGDGRWETERRGGQPLSGLQRLDAVAGEDEGDDVEQRAGGAEEIFERQFESQLQDGKARQR